MLLKHACKYTETIYIKRTFEMGLTVSCTLNDFRSSLLTFWYRICLDTCIIRTVVCPPIYLWGLFRLYTTRWSTLNTRLEISNIYKGNYKNLESGEIHLINGWLLWEVFFTKTPATFDTIMEIIWEEEISNF